MIFRHSSVEVYIDVRDFVKTNVFNAAVEDMIAVVEDLVPPSISGFEGDMAVGYDLITACTSTGQTKPNGDAVIRNVSPEEYRAANATADQFSLARVSAAATITVMTIHR